MSTSKYLKTVFDTESGILTIALDRQDSEKNSIDSGMIEALHEVLHAERVKPRARGLLLVSAHEKVFSTGADIEGELKDLNSLEASLFTAAGREVFSLLGRLTCPTVALISGFALGGGLELALSCDFRIGVKTARFGLPEINLGVIPGWGGTQRLPRLIGRSRALKMILTGDPINAATALEYGLIDELVESYTDLPAAGEQFLKKILQKSRSALALAKRAVHEGTAMSLEDGLTLESQIFSAAWGTADRVEGINAFIEKRRPDWQE
ncbi:enoyl-CoA hydratase/isomerase family protein [bacterium]|nr:enoyl-CoA hydratase/isomerase family protein [bacterium]